MPLVALPGHHTLLPQLLVDQLDGGVEERDLVFLCMDGEVMASQARVATLSPLLYSLMQGQVIDPPPTIT